MKAVATDFGIQKALNILGVKAINEGTSTGSNWFSNGELIESYQKYEGLALTEGFIAIQAESAPTEFRKIELMEIDN